MVDEAKYQNQFVANECCVIIPTYNNTATLAQVIKSVLQYTSNIIVVNDGSTDHTVDILKSFPDIHIYQYPKNKGKGFALRSGFKEALSVGYKYAITIDSDGQHMASDLLKFIEALEENPKAIIIGARNMNQENVPGKSSFGNKFSNFWIKLETGYDMPDTQSGYRLYPIEHLSKIKFYTNKFEFEVEVLTRSAWRGIDLISIPIEVYYAPTDERVSHFRPFKDFTRISILNTYLVTLTFLIHLPKRILRKVKKKSLKAIIKEDILGSNESNLKIAQAIAFGVFMGILPVWGYQLIIGFTLAHLMKLNKSLFFISANISMPPMIPVILFVSFITGGYILPDGVTSLEFSHNISFSTVFSSLKQYIVGALVFAVLAGLASLIVSYLTLCIFRKQPKKIS